MTNFSKCFPLFWVYSISTVHDVTMHPRRILIVHLDVSHGFDISTNNNTICTSGRNHLRSQANANKVARSTTSYREVSQGDHFTFHFCAYISDKVTSDKDSDGIVMSSQIIGVETCDVRITFSIIICCFAKPGSKIAETIAVKWWFAALADWLLGR